ncbi:glycosyltransferase family 2 protein [Pseudomonas sp. PB120]|nr:glycosyltransferase family 2 protein [Pseudomonas sp. PB120]
MCTYNGEQFLRQQLDSFYNQTHKNWVLIVSDDGSTDSTIEILDEFSKRLNPGQLRVIYGPKKGYVKNFLDITRRVESTADFYAWADQDDIWIENKVEAALGMLKCYESKVPALYCGRTQLINESGTSIGHSIKFSREPQFLNALVQSIGGGNTMVFNRSSLELLNRASNGLDVVSHDWWAYQLISGAGGKVLYDNIARVLYRQHSKNIIGDKRNWLNKARHITKVFEGLHLEWNDKNIHALELTRDCLSNENKTILDIFKTARKDKFMKRISRLFRLGIHRQTFTGNIALYLAILFGKI